MAEIRNLWDKVTIYCLNHETPEPMEVIKNVESVKTPFYACKHYLDSKENGTYCPNRLNLDDYQGIVLKLMDEISDAGMIGDFTNFSFNYKRTRQKTLVRVLKYDNEEIRLGIYNCTVFGKDHP